MRVALRWVRLLKYKSEWWFFFINFKQIFLYRLRLSLFSLFLHWECLGLQKWSQSIPGYQVLGVFPFSLGANWRELGVAIELTKRFGIQHDYISPILNEKGKELLLLIFALKYYYKEFKKHQYKPINSFYIICC